MCDEQFLDSFQQSIFTAGHEGGQVFVDLGAKLAALLLTLQLNTGARQTRAERHTQYNADALNVKHSSLRYELKSANLDV